LSAAGNAISFLKLKQFGGLGGADVVFFISIL